MYQDIRDDNFIAPGFNLSQVFHCQVSHLRVVACFCLNLTQLHQDITGLTSTEQAESLFKRSISRNRKFRVNL